MSNGEIAICLSGQMRQFHICLPEFFQHLAVPLGADIFIHTWDDQGQTDAHKLQKSLIPRDDGNGSYLLTSTTGEYSQSSSVKITPQMIETIYSPVAFEIENQKSVKQEQQFEKMIPDWLKNADPFTSGMIDMLYTQHRVQRMRQEYEKKRGKRYRLVINTLPDLLWTAPLPSEQASGEKFWSCSQYIASSYQISCKLSLGSSKQMDIYAALYHELNKYFVPSILERPKKEWPISERLLFQHFRRKEEPVSYFCSPTIRIRERPLPLKNVEWVNFQDFVKRHK